MGRNAAWLSEKQVGVLDWIKDGCPSRGPEVDYGRRITARALHRRGLVTIKGSGASWTASITKPGLAWQEAHPEAKLGEAQVDDLIGRVQAAGGRLVLPGGRDIETAYKELVRISDQSPTRPKGWRLKLHNAGSWADPRHEVVLVRHFDDLVEAVPVPVPRHVARYHPTIRAFLSDKKSHEVRKAYLDRAAHILQALADEAPRRGLTVLSAEQARSVVDRHQYQTIGGCRLALRSSEGAYAIRIKELSASPGNLELVVYGPGASYDGDRYRDTKTITVEDRLPQLFRALEIYRLRAELRFTSASGRPPNAGRGGGPRWRKLGSATMSAPIGTRSSNAQAIGTQSTGTASSWPLPAKLLAGTKARHSTRSWPTSTPRSVGSTSSTRSVTLNGSCRRSPIQSRTI